MSNSLGPELKKNIWDLDIKAYFFCRNNGLLVENMDKGLTVPKWVLIFLLKIPQMPKKCWARFVYLLTQAQKFGIFEKKLSLGVRSPCSFIKDIIQFCVHFLPSSFVMFNINDPSRQVFIAVVKVIHSKYCKH